MIKLFIVIKLFITKLPNKTGNFYLYIIKRARTSSTIPIRMKRMPRRR